MIPYSRWDSLVPLPILAFTFIFTTRILSFLSSMLMMHFSWVLTAPTYLKLKKQEFMKKWESHDLGEVKEYLDMWIMRDHIKKTLKLDQISYTDKVIKCFKLNDAKIARTPLSSGYNSMHNMTQSTPHLWSRYQSVIGSLLYIMLGTRPDIAQAVIKMSQFSSNPSEEHLQKALYLCGISPVPRIPALNMMEPVNLVLWHTLILTGQVIMKLADLPLDTLSS